MIQRNRILHFIRVNPGCSTMEIQLELSPFVANPRARISDLRARGHVIECRRRADKFDGYWLVETAQLELPL